MDVTVLAALAGNTLMQAMVTDAWEGTRVKIASWFGRGEPDSKALERLDRTYAELITAPPDDLKRLGPTRPGPASS